MSGPALDPQASASSSAISTVADTDGRPVLDHDGTSGTVLRRYAYSAGPNEAAGQMNVAAGARAGSEAGNGSKRRAGGASRVLRLGLGARLSMRPLR